MVPCKCSTYRKTDGPSNCLQIKLSDLPKWVLADDFQAPPGAGPAQPKPKQRTQISSQAKTPKPANVLVAESNPHVRPTCTPLHPNSSPHFNITYAVDSCAPVHPTCWLGPFCATPYGHRLLDPYSLGFAFLYLEYALRGARLHPTWSPQHQRSRPAVSELAGALFSRFDASNNTSCGLVKVVGCRLSQRYSLG